MLVLIVKIRSALFQKREFLDDLWLTTDLRDCENEISLSFERECYGQTRSR